MGRETGVPIGMKRMMTWAFLVLLLVAMALRTGRSLAQRQTARKIAITSSNGIASLERVRLGGAEQWIQIRGQNRDNPVLLFLHGGPGFPEMPFAHANADLEKQFVVVHWDQRGAGKSYPAPPPGLNLEQFVADTHELVTVLLNRFHAEKLVLVGHSWGSLVGILTVSRYPELFSTYIGVSQFANAAESERLMYRFAIESAGREGNRKVLEELRRMGPPPYESIAQFKRMQAWVEHYNDSDYRPISPCTFAKLAFSSPAYSWLDLARIPLGAQRSFEDLWREAFYKVDLFEQVPRVDVPVYFFLGRHNRTVTASSTLAEKYFRAIDAPRGKEIVWFEHSGHWPQLEEPTKYGEMMIQAALQQTVRDDK